MPTSVSQPQQYTAYNPAKHGGDQPNEANSSYARRIPESQWPRESVGAVLDAYYNEPEYLEYYAGNDNFKGASYEGPSSSHLDGGHKPNFSRPVLDNRQPPKEPIDPYWSGSLPPPTTDFQEAHPSRSHPHIRAAGGDGVLYDGATELSAEVPAFANSDRSEDSLPTHPSPSSMREYSSPNRLPAHPPPIRPGLLKSSSRGHPAPQRQYDIVRTSPDTIPASESTPLTVAELEKLSNAAKMNPGDHKLQLTLAKKMVEAATVLASEDGRADVKTTRKNRENYIYDAHKIIKRLTTSSHPYPDAVFFLASCYGEGQLGLQIDHERAYTLYQSAAKLNHGASAYRTAVCCELGAGIRKDPVKAMTWYKKAASLGETPAMFKLGMIQWKGLLGQPRNPRDGIIWLKRAADQADENNQHALHELGLLYERADSNDVIIPDHNYARELFMRAADLGYPASQFRMGCAYEYGTMGCPIDPKKSIAWYSKAAMKGDLESQLALSGWYLTGSDGVIQQSDTEAYLWARKAAEKGLAKAEYALGYFTEVGIGVPGNLDEAKRWYYKAASQQHPKAQLRLQELKKGGVAVQKSRERLSRSNPKHKEDGDCAIM
ncbi:hypothetical protein EDC01DRAFT_610211 [Geopyxis carbonaria]|nr:hypothetical protein EDC01DRAFT_610211 [Geopyxis carbonaria]